MKLSDNRIRLEQLYDLTSLVELNLSCNFITHITFPENPILKNLQTLNLAYNKIPTNLIL